MISVLNEIMVIFGLLQKQKGYILPTILCLFENYLLCYLSIKYLVVKDIFSQHFEPASQYSSLT